MKTIKDLEQEKAKIEEQIEVLKAQEQEKDFIEVKDFRIYKWAKPIKDFPMPKGFQMAEFQEFVDLYDNDLIELEKYPVKYFLKHYSKKQQKKEWCLSGLYLGRNLVLGSDNDDLAYSSVNGRVVVHRISKKVKS